MDKINERSLDIKKILKNPMAEDYNGMLYRLLIFTITSFLLLSITLPGRFLTIANFKSIAFQFPEFGFLAFGITFAMITGGIDLSVITIANLSGIISALFMTNFPGINGELKIILAIFIAIGIGLSGGALNGFLIGKLKITPILATLGTMQLFSGISLVLTGGHAIYGFPEGFQFFGNGSVLGIPMPLMIFIFFSIAISIILNKTTFGFKMYILGSNETTSKFSGFKNKLIILKTYMLSGLFASISGLIIISRANSAKADYGSSYLLPAILVTVMGGTDDKGGFGKISGVIISILALRFLSSGFKILRFSPFFENFIYGVIILLVMVVNYYAKKSN